MLDFLHLLVGFGLLCKLDFFVSALGVFLLICFHGLVLLLGVLWFRFAIELLELLFLLFVYFHVVVMFYFFVVNHRFILLFPFFSLISWTFPQLVALSIHLSSSRLHSGTLPSGTKATRVLSRSNLKIALTLGIMWTKVRLTLDE